MLAALCVGRLRRRLLSLGPRPPTVHSEFVKAGSGRYLKITAYTGKNGIPDWGAVRRAAGTEAGRLLLPRGIKPPPDIGITPFAGVELARKLMELSAAAMLKIVAINPRMVKISIYDLQAVMPDLPLTFLPYASDIRVITLRPERFARSQFEAMHQSGAVLTVTGDLAALSGSLIILAPDGLPRDYGQRFCARGWVLSARRSTYNNGKGVINGYIPRLSGRLLAAVPNGCDALNFLAGLYELSGVNEIADKPPEFIQTEGHTITLKDAAWLLAGIDIGISV